MPGVEGWRDGAYRRTVRLESGPAVVALTPRADHVELAGPEETVECCRLRLDGTGPGLDDVPGGEAAAARRRPERYAALRGAA